MRRRPLLRLCYTSLKPFGCRRSFWQLCTLMLKNLSQWTYPVCGVQFISPWQMQMQRKSRNPHGNTCHRRMAHGRLDVFNALFQGTNLRAVPKVDIVTSLCRCLFDQG